MLKIFRGLLLALVIFIALIPLVLNILNVDEVYNEGEAHGFVIGESKRQTYKRASENLPRNAYGKGGVFLLVTVNKSMSPIVASAVNRKVFVGTYMEEVGYQVLKELDEWKFYYGPNNFNFIELNFCESNLCRSNIGAFDYIDIDPCEKRLCEIRRVNVRMELP